MDMTKIKYPKALSILADLTYGESYSTHKYCFDTLQPPDSFFEQEKDYSFQEYGESISHKDSIPLVDLVQKLDKPIFSFFLDGSRRTYKIDDIRYGEKIYPVLIGQIGVACCQRHSSDNFKSLRTENRLILAIPAMANADGEDETDFCIKIKNRINNESSLKNLGIKISKTIAYPERRDLEYSKIAIAALHDEMLDMEKEFVNWLVNEKRLLTPDAQLIKDGSIEYQKSKRGSYRDISRLISNYKCVIGVSKKFNPEKCVDRNGKSNATLIAKLPLYHRTPVFKFKSGRSGGAGGPVYIAAWYVRIRDIKHTVSPFDGVIKVERILTDERAIENGLPSDSVNFISANLIWERNPTCYGSDLRWANHLYPIYLTELSLKSSRLSDHVIMNIM